MHSQVSRAVSPAISSFLADPSPSLSQLSSLCPTLTQRPPSSPNTLSIINANGQGCQSNNRKLIHQDHSLLLHQQPACPPGEQPPPQLHLPNHNHIQPCSPPIPYPPSLQHSLPKYSPWTFPAAKPRTSRLPASPAPRHLRRSLTHSHHQRAPQFWERRRSLESSSAGSATRSQRRRRTRQRGRRTTPATFGLAERRSCSARERRSLSSLPRKRTRLCLQEGTRR